MSNGFNLLFREMISSAIWLVGCRAAVDAIMEQLGTDRLDTLFLAVPVEAVPLIGQYIRIADSPPHFARSELVSIGFEHYKLQITIFI